MRARRGLVGAAALCLSLIAAAAGGDSSVSGPARAEDPALRTAKAAIAAGDYATAQTGLKLALASDPGNADLHNLYAYALRKGPSPDMERVLKHYQEALRIDPKHRGAHEYIGEAYLMLHELPKAKQHLAALDKLCVFGCSEYSDLKKAIADYEAKPR